MDVILVINAGSSSIKFHAFRAEDAQLEPIAGGKLEEIYTNPRFTAKRQNGEVIEDRRW
ncbi:MAG TPA: acetate kinase, partial [Paraburkholderia sp.]|nr:acetate kinase [Paraburkholderia sp.]